MKDKVVPIPIESYFSHTIALQMMCSEDSKRNYMLIASESKNLDFIVASKNRNGRIYQIQKYIPLLKVITVNFYINFS